MVSRNRTPFAPVYNAAIQGLALVCDNPKREVQIIFSHLLGEDIRLDRPEFIANSCVKAAQKMLHRRSLGEPLQYIIGRWEFYGIPLFVGKGVLCPRPDSECVATAAIDYLKTVPTQNPLVLDLCSGTGALALAIKKSLPKADVVAVERYKPAYNYLKRNLNGTDISPIKADIKGFEKTLQNESVTLIICNPPYIDKKEKSTIPKELTYEPENALFEPSPFYFYRYIAVNYQKKLTKNGVFVFEIADNKEDEICNLFSQMNLSSKKIIDLNKSCRGVEVRDWMLDVRG